MTSLAEVLSSHTHHMKKMTKTIEKLANENRALSGTVERLSRKCQVYDGEIAKMQSENKEMSELLKQQTKEITIIHTNLTKLQTQVSKVATANQFNDAFVEDLATRPGHTKRVLLHSDDDILRLVTTHSSEIQKLQTDIGTLKSDLPKGVSGSTYVRWGRNNCSGNGTELVYSGYAAGADYRNSGGAANYICLSPDPLWGHYSNAHDASATVFGGEYRFEGVASRIGYDTTAYFHKSVRDDDAPCSVCWTRRSTAIMIPGRNQCYGGWTLEYKGYLVAGDRAHKAASEYVCLDDHPDVIIGGNTSQDGKLFYFAEGRCGSLKCPPYVHGRELTCVVCSK